MHNKLPENYEYESEINLFEYLIVLLKHKRLIFAVTFAFMIAAVAMTFLMTPTYRAKTVIMPLQPSSASFTPSSMGSIKTIAGFPQNPFDLSSPNQLSIEILNCTHIADRLVDRFDLMKLYEVEYKQDAINMLKKQIKVSGENNALLSIVVEGTDPKLIADIANAMVKEYEALMRSIRDSQLQQRKSYIEDHFNRVKEDLIKAEDDMRLFQEETGAVNIDDQARITISSISRIKAQIAAREVELGVMKTFTTQKNPDRQKLEEQITGLKKELKKLEEETDPDGSMISTDAMPEMEIQYLRKLRELEFQEALFSIVAQQYETVRAEENMKAPMVQIIDEAIPPEKRFKPQKKKFLIFISFIGFIFSILIALLVDNLQKLAENPQKAHLIDDLKRNLRLRKE